MRSSFLALSLILFAFPAQAATELSLPLGYQSLVYSAGGKQSVAQGFSLPLIWLSGGGKRLNLDSTLGYAYLQTPGGKGQFAAFENDLSFKLPIGAITPSVGIHGLVWAPLSTPTDLTGWATGLAPMVGIQADLGLFILEAEASEGPMWGLAEQGKAPYRADLTRFEGRVTFGF